MKKRKLSSGLALKKKSLTELTLNLPFFLNPQLTIETNSHHHTPELANDITAEKSKSRPRSSQLLKKNDRKTNCCLF